MNATSAALGDLFRGWVARRQEQVADLAADGIRDPHQVAERLDMTVEAAREYLARGEHESSSTERDRG